MFIGLERDQVFAQPLLGKLRRFFRAVDQLHAPGLAPATRVHLGFYHPLVTTNFSGFGCDLFRSIAGETGRNWQTIISKKLL